MLAQLAQRIQRASGLHLGATDLCLPAEPEMDARGDAVDVVVVGAHLSGEPLNYQLAERGAKLVRAVKTAPRYRLYALSDSTPPKPGLVRETTHGGHAIEVEVWRMPTIHYGSFVATIPAPLGIGRIEMENGAWLQGFLCEAYALAGAEEISRHGGWRAYRAAMSIA